MQRATPRRHPKPTAFTLIELLVVISIISLLISILLPSLNRARDQAKSLHCLARLHEFGTAMATYENMGALPPALWYPDPEELDDPSGPNPVEAVAYGWTEVLFPYVYAERVQVPESFPVQRNIEGERWEKYFICQAVGDDGINSGHYRVYLPSWAAGSYTLEADGRWGDDTHANPLRGPLREKIRPKLPLMGDANDQSERGDGLGTDDCSYIDAGEANYAGSNGRSNGNRFSDRHYGGTNFLFADLHATWERKLRENLGRDFDLNGVVDLEVDP